jgi:cytochrome P450
MRSRLTPPPSGEWERAQPHAEWARASGEGAVADAPPPPGLARDAICVLRFEASDRVLRDAQRFGSGVYAAVQGDYKGRTLRELDGEPHRRTRALVAHAFRPAALARYERAWIRPILRELLAAIAPRGRAELLSELCAPFPVQVICGILGLPRADHAQFLRWSDAINLGPLDPERGRTASAAMAAYFAPRIARCRREPAEDLLSELAHAEFEGERLDDERILGFLRLLVPAGAETTYRMLGTLLALLLGHPRALAALRADPARIPAAIEEALRFEGSVTLALRIAREDSVLGGCAVAAGTPVQVALASANRDPSRWPDPDAWNPERAEQRHLAFGAGPHACLGIGLARLELRAALEEILAALPGLRLDPGAPPPVVQGYAFRGPDRVAVRFDPSAGRA